MNRLLVKYIHRKENIIYIILLIIVAVASHVNWFSYSNIIDFGDQIFYHSETLKEFYFSSNTWWSQFNIGSSNIQLFTYPVFGLISSYLANLGLNSAFIFNLIFLIPIAILGFISPYILSKKLIKYNPIAFSVALFYGSTTEFLIRQNSHASIALVEALAPLIFYFFIIALEKNKLNYWIYFLFIYSFGIFYEIRLMYLLTIVLIFYFIFFCFNQIKIYWRNIIFSIIILILINIFWLLPVFTGSASNHLGVVINRPLLNNFQYNILNAFNVFNYVWTEFTNVSLKNAFYLWFLPLLSFLSLFFLKFNKKYKKEIIFFALVSLIGIIIAKQAAVPFMGLFQWLRENFPGFIIFRDSYKFYFVISFGYLGLLSYSLLYFKNNRLRIFRVVYYLFIIFIFIISLLNLRPFLQKKLDTNKIKTVQSDYLMFNNLVVSQEDFFRSLEVPRRFRWIVYTVNHPGVSFEHLLVNDFPKLNTEYSLFVKDRNLKNIELFKKDYSNQLFDVLSIKYITIPPRDTQYNRDLWQIFYGENGRYLYIAELDKLFYLKKIYTGTDGLVIYENEGFRPHIYITAEKETIYKEISYEKIEFSQSNSTEYRVHLKNISQKVFLNFSEKYHYDWKLRVGAFNWFQALLDKKYFLFDGYHYQNDANLNSFYLDPAEICQDYICSQNADGSYNINLTLYFKPQSYFYLGLIISGSTLLGCFVYLGYDFINRRKRRKEEIKNNSNK